MAVQEADGIAEEARAKKPAPKTLQTLFELLVVAFCTLSFGFTALGVLHSLLEKNAAGHRDFVEYWAAGQQLAHHANPYDRDALLLVERKADFPSGQPAMIMPNPPVALALVAPLGYLSPLRAELLWCSLLLAGLIASVWAMRRLHKRPASALDLLAYFFAPALCCLLTGQMSMLVLVGLAFFLLWNGPRPMLAGCALAFCALKPHLLLPFGIVLLAWIFQTRRYRLLAGAALALALAFAVALILDPHALADYRQMMALARVDRVAIPCLSNALRRAVAPDAMWLQYLPAVLGCIWAMVYYRRHRFHWDWTKHGSLLALVSLIVAPYSWFTDQVVVVPALLHALYTTRSRTLVSVLALASAIVQLSIFGGGTRMLHSPWLLLTAPFWLGWYLLATRSAQESFSSIDIPRTQVCE
jgi:hypothetical protein